MDRIAHKAATFFIDQGAGNKHDREAYEYGIVVAMSFSINVLVAVVLGLAFSIGLELIVFFIPFAIHRGVSGGYHAKTWWGCLLMSGFVIVAAVFLIRTLAQIGLLPISIVFWIFVIVATLLFAPVENPNRPLTNLEKVKFRKYSLLFTPICIFFATVLLFFDVELFSLCITLALVASCFTQLVSVMKILRKEMLSNVKK
jgi:accessory gene regulator B